MDIFQHIIDAQKAGTPAVLATVVEVTGSAPGRAGGRMLVSGDGSIIGTIGGGAVEKTVIDEARQLLAGTATRLLRYTLEDIGMTCGGAMAVFLEPLLSTPALFVFGAGHIGSALSRIGKLLDFAVTVIDNRPEFADPQKLPWADTVIARAYPDALEELALSENSYAVILTHRHAHDFEILNYCAGKPLRYLGMIGSRKKVATAFDQLRKNGVTEEAIAQIHAPIGIDIGANTPAEIAVAIAAELIAVRGGARAAS